MVENRRKTRIPCHGKLLVSHKRGTAEGRVVDVSQTGLRISIKEKLTVGQYVFLRFPGRALGGKSLRAVVRWIQLGAQPEAGLEFLSPDGKWSRRWLSRLCPSITTSEFDEQRRTEVRTLVNLPVALWDFSEGVTLDLSRSGACFVMPERIEKDSELFLCLPRMLMPLQARLVRSEASSGGWTHSVKFTGVPEAHSEILQSFVEERQRVD